MCYIRPQLIKLTLSDLVCYSQMYGGKKTNKDVSLGVILMFNLIARIQRRLINDVSRIDTFCCVKKLDGKKYLWVKF